MRPLQVILLAFLLFGVILTPLGRSKMTGWTPSDPPTRRTLQQLPLTPPPTCLYPVRRQANYSSKHVCVGVRTYADQAEELDHLLASLLAPGYAHLSIYLANTDLRSFPVPLAAYAARMNRACCCDHVHAFPRSQADVKREFPLVPPDMGYVITDYFIDFFLSQRQCDYFLFTNGDNVYNATFFEEVLPRLDRGVDIVATYFSLNIEIKHHFGWCKTKGGRGKRRCEILARSIPRYFNTSFARHRIDLGCIAYSRRLFEATGERFVLRQLREDPTGRLVCQNGSMPIGDWYNCDADFIERVVHQPGVTSEIIPKVLFIHK